MHVGLSYVTTLHDRSTQTSDVITDNSASSPSRQPRRDLYTRTFGSSAAEVTSRRESSRYFVWDDDDKKSGSELALCGRCGGATLSRHGETAQSASGNKPPVNGSDVLSALIALLSDHLTCHRCATTTNQAQSPPAGQVPNHDVPLATVDNTAPVSPRNNSELGPTAVSNAGEVMRYILRDIKQLKASIIRQGAARGGGGEKRHQANVTESQQLKKERPNRPIRASRSVSDDEDKYRPSKGIYRRYATSPDSFPTTTSDCRVSGYVRAKRDDRTANRLTDRREGCSEGLYNYNLQSPTSRRSSRRSKSPDDDVDGRYRDSFPKLSSHLRRRSSRNRPAGVDISESAPNGFAQNQQTLPPRGRSEHVVRQPPLPGHAQQQFQPQQTQV